MFVALLGLLSSAGRADAGDGRFEINQTRAVAGGVSTGDAPGFPVTISTPGSYVLTGPLTVANLNTTAVLVTAPDGVSLDLNGFTIRGACPAVGGCAAGAGSSRGIDATASSGIAVRDGRVIGFASDGVATGTRARIEELLVAGNGGAGIRVESGSEIGASRAFDNAGTGISAPASLVLESSADANLDGIVGGDRSIVEGNNALDNARIGILAAGRGVTVRANVVANSAADGIAVTQAGSLVVDNLTWSNAAAGVAVLTTGSVQRNVAYGNGLGFYLVPEAGGNAAAYRGNAAASNGFAEVSGGLSMGENSCHGNATCP